MSRSDMVTFARRTASTCQHVRAVLCAKCTCDFIACALLTTSTFYATQNFCNARSNPLSASRYWTLSFRAKPMLMTPSKDFASTYRFPLITFTSYSLFPAAFTNSATSSISRNSTILWFIFSIIHSFPIRCAVDSENVFVNPKKKTVSQDLQSDSSIEGLSPDVLSLCRNRPLKSTPNLHKLFRLRSISMCKFPLVNPDFVSISEKPTVDI